MSIDKISGALHQRTGGLDHQFFFAGQDDFASKLTVGQVLKAKVLRHHEGSRYVADINGQQKVVDSANPLRPGELIEGRVKSLGKQVELQRINVASQQRAETVIPESPDFSALSLLSGQEKQLQAARQFFIERQSSLTIKEMQVLKTFLSRGVELSILLLSALSLKKAGVEISQNNMTSIIDALKHKSDTKSQITDAVIALDVDASATQSSHVPHDAIKGLSREMVAQSNVVASLYAKTSDDAKKEFSGEKNSDDLSYKILNIQDDSAIKHQLMTFPIWLGDKLIEIRMAFFDQQQTESDHNEGDSQYKRFVFTLNLDGLGDVVASAVIYGKHVALSMTSEQSRSSEFLSQHMGSLIKNIEAMGWSVDKIDYATVQKNDVESATLAVVEHYASKDSISRVF